MEILPPQIESYAEKHTTPPTEVLKKLLRATYERTEIPQMAVGAVEGAFLKMIVQISGARRVLEIGTFTGYSALTMAEGLPDDGELITCDINQKTVAIAEEFWAKSPHGKKIRAMLGPALKTLAKLPGPFDLVFIDADKENYPAYWKACLPKLNSGGLILADNVLWGGSVLKPKTKDEKAIVHFNQIVARDHRVEAVMLTVRDGITLARKK